MIKKPPFIIALLLLFAFTPTYLTMMQNVPTRFAFQHVVLLLSLGAFGLLLGQFWLSRRLPHEVAGMPTAGVIRLHKIIGYTAGTFLLLHPVLLIARRFWTVESNPVDNLLLMVRSPAALPALIAWVLLLLIVLLSLPPVHRSLRGSTWRILHGLLALGFAGLATWHVVAVGRHSNSAMSAFWIVLATGAMAGLLLSYRSTHLKPFIQTTQEVVNETAR